MADLPTSEKSFHQRERNAAARLLDALEAEGCVSMVELAPLARVSVAQLEACRSGKRRLDPLEQMRIAAAVVELAPNQARRAYILYAQAQAELRFSSRESKSGTSHDGWRVDSISPLSDESNPPKPSDVRVEAIELSARSARARERAVELANETNRLLNAAQAFATARQSLRGSIGEVFRDEVEHFTIAARAAGEPPERALVLLKAAVEPVLATVPEQRVEIMARTVNWFINAYYPG
jgi:hypothetical protein